jgi:hypothetical protein
MGGFLSTQKSLLPQSSSSYADKARISKELADRILHLLFQRADFHDILSLSSLNQCPRYVFTTAQALQTLFQSIQIYPKLGKAGEVLFTPVSHISPGLIKDKSEGTQELLERTKLRNQMCIDIAYMYVRIFQIYGALALTVLDTDPTRRKSQVLPMARQGFFSTQQPSTKPKTAAFFGGSLSQREKIRSDMLKVAFAPLVEYVSIDKDNYEDGINFLKLDDKDSSTAFLIKWKPSDAQKSKSDSSMTLKGIYDKRGREELDFEITMDSDSRAPYMRGTKITMKINGTEIQSFYKKLRNWEFIYEEEGESAVSPKRFYEKIHEYFADEGNSRDERSGSAPVGRRSASASGSASASAGLSISSSSGKSAFEGFEQLKKLYDDRYAGKEFPKAYCVARAMILLMPIFDSERLDKRQPFYSQVCKTTYDFESMGDLMPRARKRPNANIYLRSLVSLYYDDYQIRGNEVVFKQTASGIAELRKASAQIAALYGITTNPETFLESNTEFKQFDKLCQDSAAKTGKDTLMELRDPKLVQKLAKEVVMPMLKFQEEHTKVVNQFFNKMFDFKKVDERGNKSMGFSEALRKGGRESVNEFCAQARRILLNYYLKSEAYYVQGVVILERNQTGILKI